MAFRTNHIFVNLPVKELNQSMDFFKQVGFEFDVQFTDETAACMVIGENIYAMLITEEKFKGFTNKDINDTASTSEVIIAVSAESKDRVKEIVQRALDAGGQPSGDPVDHGFMYYWSFQDLDGHIWEVMYMDESHLDS